MMKHKLFLLCMAMLVAIGGCKYREEYWINPDGSGKVYVRIEFEPGEDPERARQHLCWYVLGLQEQGVEKFRDVSLAREGDRAVISFTAYFQDVTKLKSHGWWPLVFERHAPGKMMLHGPAEPETKTTAPPKGPWGDASVRQVMAKSIVRSIKSEFTQNGGAQLQATRVVHVRGADDLRGFTAQTRNGVHTLTATVDGATLVKKLDMLPRDATAVEKLLGSVTMEQQTFRLRAALLGPTAAPNAVLPTTGAALFDYAAESAKGAPGTVPMLMERGVIPREPPARPKRVEPWVAQGFFPAQSGRGPTLNFSTKLPGRCVDNSATCYYIQAENGEFVRSHPTVGPSGDRGDQLNLNIQLPAEIKAAKLKRIVGVCQVALISGYAQVDLGEIEFRPGATGKLMGLKIESWEVEQIHIAFDGHLTVSLDKDVKNVGSIRFRDLKEGNFFVVSNRLQKPWTHVSGMHRFSVPPGTRFSASACVWEGHRKMLVPIDLRDVSVPAPDSGEAKSR